MSYLKQPQERSFVGLSRLRKLPGDYAAPSATENKPPADAPAAKPGKLTMPALDLPFSKRGITNKPLLSEEGVFPEMVAHAEMIAGEELVPAPSAKTAAVKGQTRPKFFEEAAPEVHHEVYQEVQNELLESEAASPEESPLEESLEVSQSQKSESEKNQSGVVSPKELSMAFYEEVLQRGKSLLLGDASLTPLAEIQTPQTPASKEEAPKEAPPIIQASGMIAPEAVQEVEAETSPVNLSIDISEASSVLTVANPTASLSRDDMARLQHKLYEAMLYLGDLITHKEATLPDIQARLDALKVLMLLYQDFQHHAEQ
ncbi:MAG: hypothetical protein VKJ04_04720 [Vampirovibrionales bacterium]|nr:hypothetical protein [Vampirovibrionales bacterium]